MGAVALVTGAGGEIGRQLVLALESRGFGIVALDRAPLPPELAERCLEVLEADLLDLEGLRSLFERHAPTHVFHLAAVLSSHAEKDPQLAHRVNVDGTLGLFGLCRETRERKRRAVRMLFPSSIAVYGLPDATTKAEQGAIREWQWTEPAGIYGCNKRYCELVGSYLANRPEDAPDRLDFRSLRFPGLISAETLPTGGTTDFAPEMIHAAARGEAYACFVGEDTRLPFMTMPDAVEALLSLSDADESRLTKRVYNVKGFSCTAGEIRREVLRHHPDARITFEPVPLKQAIVDSWPADVDDSRARRDWGVAPRHDLREAFRSYLVPALRRRYGAHQPSAADPQRFPQPS